MARDATPITYKFPYNNETHEADLIGLIVLRTDGLPLYIPASSLTPDHWLMMAPEQVARCWPVTPDGYFTIHVLIGAAGISGEADVVWDIGARLGFSRLDYVAWANHHQYSIRSLPKDFAPIPLVLAYPKVSDELQEDLESLSYGRAAVGVNELVAMGGLLREDYAQCDTGQALLQHIREIVCQLDPGTTESKQVH